MQLSYDGTHIVCHKDEPVYASLLKVWRAADRSVTSCRVGMDCENYIAFWFEDAQ